MKKELAKTLVAQLREVMGGAQEQLFEHKEYSKNVAGPLNHWVDKIRKRVESMEKDSAALHADMKKYARILELKQKSVDAPFDDSEEMLASTLDQLLRDEARLHKKRMDWSLEVQGLLVDIRLETNWWPGVRG